MKNQKMEDTAIFLEDTAIFPDHFLFYICNRQEEITGGMEGDTRPMRDECQEKQTIPPCPCKEKERMRQGYLST